jgi:glycosyl transferase family 25
MNPFQNGRVGAAYVVHARRFTDRAVQMKRQLDQREIPFEFIEPYDADALTAADLDLFSDANKPMARGQKSCTLKHIEALRRIAAADHRLGLVFEDDAILDPQFMAVLEKIVAEAQSFTHLHVLYIGVGSNMFVPWRKLRRGRHLYEATESRCAEAYLIGAPAARARLAWLESHKIDRPIDHLYTLMDPEIGIQMYWSNPGVVEQGSMNGFYFTSQEVGSKLRRLWQLKLRFKVQRLRRKYLYRFFR